MSLTSDSSLFSIPEQAVPPISLFSKAGVMLLYVGMIGLFFMLQLVGVYLFAPYVIDDPSLSRTQAFFQGSFNGTVTSYAMLFTLLILLLFSYLLVNLLINRRHAKLQKSPTLASTKDPAPSVCRSPEHINLDVKAAVPVIKNHYSVSDYLGIKPFALHVAVGFIGLWLAFVISSETLTYILDRDPTAFVDELYFSADPKWLLILVMVVVAPIYEEVVFRGLLWSALTEQFEGTKGVWIASLVTSAIFALIHLQYEWYEMGVIFVLALLLSYARAKSGSLLLPIIIHIVNNGAVMWLYLMLQ
ncbi:CPBP family intramembrane glutamic endopeptidase [Psychrobacter lutiphocae]|uniref:CPBP family intramembrane glutamic endopeptidase n=1 Tax=Psychrobacter lutiphocae TaxID=540500 RepID=UPI000477EF13|nr:CPBP family intramembrane glutamic endopeptidase [Psychrobacter lutiphocae]